MAKLYDAKLIQHFADLYANSLTESVLVKYLGKNGSKIYASIQQRKKLPFSAFLAGLGIESLGKGMANTLVKHYPTYDDLKNSSISELTLLEGISDLTASYIHSGLHNPALGDRVLSQGVSILYPDVKIPINLF